MDDRINLVGREEAPEEVAAVYDGIVAARADEMDEGMALNRMWQAYGNAPALLGIVWEHMRECYRGGSLPPDLKSKVSLVAATVLGCEGCRFFHTTRLEAEGVDGAEIERMRERELEESAFSREEYEVLRFAERVTADWNAVTDEDLQRLREVGLSDAELVELVDCIALHVHTAVFQGALGLVHEGMTLEEYVGASD